MRSEYLKWLISFSITAVFLISCSSKETVCEKAPNVESLLTEIDIERKERELFGLADKAEIASFIKNNPTYSEYFLNSALFSADSSFINSLYGLINDPYVDTLYDEVSEHFGELESLESELARSFAYLKHYFPEFQPPQIQTGISGFGTDLYISDSLIIIGLDFFLGRHGTYRPPEIPEYLVRRLEEEYIVPNIILHLSSYWNDVNTTDNSFLADMVYYGKSYYFTKRMLPCMPDSLIIQFTGEEMNDVKKNDHIIWASFLTNELLYESSHFVKRKYLEERPNIPEIGEKCPGRVGTWIGWEIVEQFMAESDYTLQELMKLENAEEIFRSSRYKPKNI